MTAHGTTDNFRLGIQLSDGCAGCKVGATKYTDFIQSSSDTFSEYAGDSNYYGPDSVQLSLLTESAGPLITKDLDFRLKIQSNDQSATNAGGVIGYTPWASEGGGYSDALSRPADGSNLDGVRVGIETRVMSGLSVTDIEVGIELFADGQSSAGQDTAGPIGTGTSIGTDWVFASSSTAVHPDSVRIYLAASGLQLELKFDGAGCGPGGNINLGPFPDVQQCAQRAVERTDCTGDQLMWSDGYSRTSTSWGCRCCKKFGDVAGGSNHNWDVYKYEAPYLQSESASSIMAQTLVTRLEYDGAGCGSGGNYNMGPFPDGMNSCAESATENTVCTGNQIMWSDGYSRTSPSWGCRCCLREDDTAGGSNIRWDVYEYAFILSKSSAGAPVPLALWLSELVQQWNLQLGTMGTAGLLTVLLVLNIACMCYWCCSNTSGHGYKTVKMVDSDLEASDAEPMII
eukprot:CAMPEP_0202687922 /NCGR_PEP_ID=MMETSP1385-20130828/3473_1 /ASSEMBLY_ACC=CAM_ASM_000861 /TAXON_ID=933848 /ORGANISM="Elphidium margaritaceum" /LENGTH=455 /DNA_ID=CAMNT_0049342781 /DNA_START=144 /DNA_END=1511 /DNA_ORIENTATION=-